MSILKDIEKQIERNGETSDNLFTLKVCKTLINNDLSSSTLWSNIAKCKFVKYGKESYASYREWSIKPEFINLIKDLMESNQ